jgi:hypothetical protein
LATHQARFAQASAGYRHGKMLRHLLTRITTWAWHRLGVALDDSSASNGKRELGRATGLQLKEPLARFLKLGRITLCFTTFGAGALFLRHVVRMLFS